MITTQKAKGIKALCYFQGQFGMIPPRIFSVIPSFLSSREKTSFPLFARPCPKTPRHGFVDSKEVSSWEEVMELYSKAVQADGRDAEIVLMPALSGKNSAVAVYNNITWGRGNSSVTSGNRGFKIPLPGNMLKWNNYWNNIKDRASKVGPSIEDSAYIELVENNGKTVVVQARNGPIPPNSGLKDVIPADIEEVKNIFNSGDCCNLLDWEKEVLKMNPFTDVVYASGASLSSHPVVHALQAGISVVTDVNTDLALGAPLKKSEETFYTLTDEDYKELANIMKKEYLYSTINNVQEEVFTAIATIQSQFIWDNTSYLMSLRGQSVVKLQRMLLSACMGEIRHFQGNSKTEKIVESFTEQPVVETRATRKVIHTHYLYFSSLEDALKLLPAAHEDFSAEITYDEEEDCYYPWSSSYGGTAWANVAQEALFMTKAIKAFLQAPNRGNWNTLIMKANSAIHQSHNGGKVLTKWITPQEMSLISELPVFGFCNQQVANLLCKRKSVYNDY